MKAVARGLLAAALLAALPLAGGCTVRPLMASAYAPPGEATAAQLSSIAVSPVGTRFGQEVRNHLLFLLNGGRGQPAKPRYIMDLSVSARTTAAARIQKLKEVQATARLEQLVADYTIYDARTGDKIASGRREISSAFDVPSQEYAAWRAERDAQDRTARELAELLHLAVAQDLVHPHNQ